MSHIKIMTKIKAYGLTKDLLEWLRAFLNNRVQCVKLSNDISGELPVISDVPQGSVLGLMLLYTNDVSDIFDGLNVACKFYADDLKL